MYTYIYIYIHTLCIKNNRTVDAYAVPYGRYVGSTVPTGPDPGHTGPGPRPTGPGSRPTGPGPSPGNVTLEMFSNIKRKGTEIKPTQPRFD